MGDEIKDNPAVGTAVIYPAEFPKDEVLMILGKLRGQSVPVKDLAKALWVILGYGLAQGIGNPDFQALAPDEVPAWDDQQVLQALLDTEGQDHNPKGAGGIAIAMLVKVALKLLAEYLI